VTYTNVIAFAQSTKQIQGKKFEYNAFEEKINYWQIQNKNENIIFNSYCFLCFAIKGKV